MKKLILTAAATAALAFQGAACTSFLVGKKASADGSTMITYAADSHDLYGDMIHTPAADHPKGSMRKVYDWDSNRYLMDIPQPAHTYAVTGNINEHGLAIGESTWGGREELAGDKGIDYGSLIYIALERARTAREAIKVMTELVDKYGYASSGESFSIADPDEAWVMELIGKGKDEKGAVWVARRIPDDCISGHANFPRIHKFPLKDPETLYAKDVISFARKKGYFSGKDEDFDFSKAYGVLDIGAARGCDGRVWSFFRHHTDKAEMDKYLPYVMRAEGETFPLWIKPQTPLTLADLKNDMRDHFEDTPLDMTQDIGAGPYSNPYRWRPLTYVVDGKQYTHERATATQQTGWSMVAQLNGSRPAPMRGILWFGADDTNTTLYVPIYCSITEVPLGFRRGNGDIITLSWDAAFWVNNYVANQAYNRYDMMIKDIRPVQQSLERGMEAEVDSLIKVVGPMDAAEASKVLTAHSATASKRCVDRYKQLGDYLFVKYLDGNVKKEENGAFKRTPEGIPAYPEFPGYNEEYYRSIVNQTGDKFRIEDPAKK